MHYSLMANLESPGAQVGHTMADLVDTARLMESLGMDAVWLTEHHFNGWAPSAAPLQVLAHLAGQCRRLHLGTAAMLLPFHHPILLAAQLALLDQLSEGRLLLGVAHGGPFPKQFQHFGIAPEEARPRMLEALQLISRLFAEEQVSFSGRFYHCEDVSLQPRPLQARLPVWLASQAEDSLTLAARAGYGFMAPSAMGPEPIAAALQRWQQLRQQADAAPLNSGGREPLVIARYFLCLPDHQQARELAAPFIRAFPTHMGAVRPARAATQPPPDVLAHAVVGDAAACAEQIAALRARFGEHQLMLKPATTDAGMVRASLRLLAEKVDVTGAASG